MAGRELGGANAAVPEFAARYLALSDNARSSVNRSRLIVWSVGAYNLADLSDSNFPNCIRAHATTD